MNEVETSMPAQQRSTFVTVLAWIFIVLAGFMTFISLLQNIMISFMFPAEEMHRAFSDPQVNEFVPAFARFMFSKVRLFFLGFLAVSAVTLVSAIGLLKRKNWARIIFIVIMSLGIAWNIATVILQHTLFTSIPEMPGGEIPAQFETMMVFMKIFTYIMVAGFTVLFGWIIKRLSSRQIRAEFISYTASH